MDDNKKKRIKIMIFICCLLIIVLCLTQCAGEHFKQTEEENDKVVEDSVLDGLTDYTLPEESLKQVLKQQEELKYLRINTRLPEYDRKGVISSNASSSFRDVNTELYRLVANYFSEEAWGQSKYAEFADPLYVMAVTNVEFGGITSPDVLLAPALPTNLGVKATTDSIKTFSYTDYLDMAETLGDRDAYRGPMQMFVTGFMNPIKPKDLQSSEFIQLLAKPNCKGRQLELAALKYVEGSGTASEVGGMYLSNSHGTYGDRFNYGDAVNRMSGSLKIKWDMFKDRNNVIVNKYGFMAMSAIGHNSSPGIFYTADDKTLGSQHYWWPFPNFGAARQYVKELSQPECIEQIREAAYSTVKNGKSSQFRINRMTGYKMAEQFVEQGYISEGLWKNTRWNHEEKVAYPIQVLYNYFILEAIYDGK